jgi:tetratricopeptide (TPR) repeat protein
MAGVTQREIYGMRYLFALLYVLPISIFAQVDREKAEQYRLEQQQARQAQLTRQMDAAVILMDSGKYAEAEVKLLEVLNNVKSVPSDLTFFFGKNSLYLEKYKQSVDWLNKYIQLKGTSGQYYQEAVDLLKKAETGLVQVRKVETEKATEILSRNYEIDCGPTGKVMCPVCKGSTVIIKKGFLGDEYKTCPYCSKHGTLTCEEYNKLIRGELEPRQ